MAGQNELCVGGPSRLVASTNNEDDSGGDGCAHHGMLGYELNCVGEKCPKVHLNHWRITHG